MEKSLFPVRRLFGSMKHEYLEELQGKLSAYLSTLLQYFSLPPHVLLDFLDYKYNVSLQLGKMQERKRRKQASRKGRGPRVRKLGEEELISE